MSSRILIIGAGLGGLSLAQGLKKAGIPFHLFERDRTSNYRAQGYRLRINGDGAAALKSNLTAELWDRFERTCAEIKLGMTMIDALSRNVITGRAGPDQTLGPKPYTADRTVLRNLLLTGLEEDISWGKEFKHYAITETDVTTHFSDGSSEEGILIVGADWLRSPMRKQYLPDHKPVDTGGRCIYGKTPLTVELTERFPAKAMNWITMIADKTPLTLFLEPFRFPKSDVNIELPQDYVYWVLGSQKDTFGLTDDKLLKLSGEACAQLSLKVTESWDPTLRTLLELQDVSQSSALRICSVIPETPWWSPSPHITLLGDAIHVMSPTGGVGANTALQDAANLCRIIAEDGVSVTSIGKYEEAMKIYARKAIEWSYHRGKRMYAQGPFDECKPVEL